MFQIDARGQACPKPVLMTKAAVLKGEKEIETTVDNITAVGNLQRYAASAGYTFAQKQEGSDYILTMVKDAAASADAPSYEDTSWSVFVTEKQLGSADNELGHNLIKMYFYTLTQMDNPPSVVAFLNEGVKLPCQEEQIIDSLKALIEKGTKVMVCGTCLNFYGLMDQLGCGIVSNMYEILEAVTSCGKMMKI